MRDVIPERNEDLRGLDLGLKLYAAVWFFLRHCVLPHLFYRPHRFEDLHPQELSRGRRSGGSPPDEPTLVPWLGGRPPVQV